MTACDREPKIVAFACSRSGWEALLSAGRERHVYPSNVKAIKVECIGAIDPALFVHAIENGADGVAVIGCRLEECRHRLGNVMAEEKLSHVRGLLELLGLPPSRIASILVRPTDGAYVAERLQHLVDDIRELGPIQRAAADKRVGKIDKETVDREVKRLVEDTKAYKCVECGKCTVVCPIPKFEPEFAMPRIIVLRSIEGMTEHLADDKDIWTCTTCGLCNSLCPFDVDYCGFVQGLRIQARALGHEPTCSHRGLIHSAMRIMAKTDLNQERLGWITPDLSVDKKSDVLYFVGCLPHFDTVLADRNLRLTDISKAAVRLMNAAGVSPNVSGDEVCCGHDLIWTGDESNFLRLMDKNLETIRNTGAEKVVFSCPECYRTFAKDYQEFEGDLGFELLHISEYLQQLMDEERLIFPKRESPIPVTYHDSCRLGIHMEVIDSPRRLFESAGLKVIEMENTKNRSYCCGNCAWTNCSSTTMKMQLERMKQAKATGAEYLLTSDPKCQIHLSCAMSGQLLIDRSLVEVPVKDMAIALSEMLERAA
ncbi:MAG: hydrogenase iron-sulfur subunit [Methanobacteriota archaeon]|nr:MAG: hydrogenase iron-sulfur subunit [Euryarchaeota archaeon]